MSADDGRLPSVTADREAAVCQSLLYVHFIAETSLQPLQSFWALLRIVWAREIWRSAAHSAER